MFLDLHTHSTASDGSLKPAELVRRAAEAGITALALTDHDSTAGLDEAEAEAGRHGMEFIRGCELSTSTEYGAVDLLGYYVPGGSAGFEARLQLLRGARMRRNALMLQKLNELGIVLDVDELAASGEGVFGRPHIARLMREKGYVKHVREAFDRYIAKDKPAFVPKEPFLPEEAVSFLSSYGVSSFLAHPMLIHAPKEWLDALVARLVPCGLTGLEAYHSEHDARGVRHILRLADKYGLLVSGGSDFHGEAKPHIALGRGKGGLKVPDFVLESLKQRRREQGLGS